MPPNADTARIRLYCFPYAGGGTWIFREWSKLMGERIAIYPVKLPGRADRLRETALTDMHEQADMLVQHLGSTLKPPYAFFGSSMGALLAYECLNRLIRGGAPPPTRLIAASAPAPSQLKISSELLHRLPDPQFLAAVQSEYQNPIMASLKEEMLPLVMPALRGDMTMYETYKPKPDTPPLSCPVSTIRGLQDRISEAAVQAWRHHTMRTFTTHHLPGGHFLVLEQETAIVALVRAELEEDIHLNACPAHP